MKVTARIKRPEGQIEDVDVSKVKGFSCAMFNVCKTGIANAKRGTLLEIIEEFESTREIINPEWEDFNRTYGHDYPGANPHPRTLGKKSVQIRNVSNCNGFSTYVS